MYEQRTQEVIDTVLKAIHGDLQAQLKLLLVDHTLSGGSDDAASNFARAAKAFYCQEMGRDLDEVEVTIEPGDDHCCVTIHDLAAAKDTVVDGVVSDI